MFCYCQLVNKWPSSEILTSGRSASTKYPLLLACGVWGRFQAGFPVSPRRVEADVNNIRILFFASWSRCLNAWNVSHSQSALPPPCTRETIGHLRKCRCLSSTCLKSKKLTPMLHFQWEKLVLVVPWSPLPFADTAGNFRCLALDQFSSTLFLNYLTWACCPLQWSSKGTNGNEAVICMRDNRSAEGILLGGGGCFNKPWIFILHVWSVLITQLNFQGNSYQASWEPETGFGNKKAKKKMTLTGIDRQ